LIAREKLIQGSYGHNALVLWDRPLDPRIRGIASFGDGLLALTYLNTLSIRSAETLKGVELAAHERESGAISVSGRHVAVAGRDGADAAGATRVRLWSRDDLTRLWSTLED
jgi:hypothetical protein